MDFMLGSFINWYSLNSTLKLTQFLEIEEFHND
jgi:hypothetical protein